MKKYYYIYINILLLLLLFKSSYALFYRSNSDEIVEISLNAICMDTHKILLGQQDVELAIKLDQVPSFPINITFISNNNYNNFDVVPKSIFFDGEYTSIKLNNNTSINVKNDNIIRDKEKSVTKNFKLKSKNAGSSHLSFNIQSNGNNIKLDEILSDKLDITVNPSTYSTNIILMVSTAMFVFSIGLSLSGNTLRGLFHRDRIPPILCGLICQFIAVPLISLIIPKLFRQNDIQVLSVFMVGISPSSIIAPIFTYYLGGDRALAVSLCLISTILGSGVYVVYIYLYFLFIPRSLELTAFPYEYVVFIVIYCLVPLLFGSLLLHFKPLWASWLKKGTTFWGAVIIITTLVVSLKDAGSVFLSQWSIYFISIILTSLSFGISVAMSKIFVLDSKKARAICMNTALPNIPLAITIIQVYINPCCSQILSAFPLFHTFWMLIEAIIIGVVMYIFFPAIETINETSEQVINNNLPNTIGNTEGLTIITPAMDDDDDDNEMKSNNVLNEFKTKTNKKRDSYLKRNISNSTLGLIGRDANDPNIEYIDEITSNGDDDSITSDTNLSNLVIPTTNLANNNVVSKKSNYLINNNSKNTEATDDDNINSKYLSPHSIQTSKILTISSKNKKAEIENDKNNINASSDIENPKFKKQKGNDSLEFDGIKKSDINSHSFQVGNKITSLNNENEKYEDKDNKRSISSTTATKNPEILKINEILNNITGNRFNSNNSIPSTSASTSTTPTPSINSIVTKTKKSNAKSIANSYISNTGTLRHTKTSSTRDKDNIIVDNNSDKNTIKNKSKVISNINRKESDDDNDDNKIQSDSELNMTPNFSVNESINLSIISEASQNSTVIPNSLNIDTSKNKNKPSLESIQSYSESLYSAIDTPDSEHSNSLSSIGNTTISPYNLNANSLLSSDIGNSYLKNYSKNNTLNSNDDNNTSLASKVFGMSKSQAVSCVPEPINIGKLKNKNKEEVQCNNSAPLSSVSINSKFSFGIFPYTDSIKDIDISASNSNRIADPNGKEVESNNTIKKNSKSININNNGNNKSQSKSNLLRTTFFNNQQHLDQSSSSPSDDKLKLSIPKKSYSTVETNEVNSAKTFCTTKTNFSSPYSSEPSAKDTSTKLKQVDVIPSPPVYQNSLDVPKSYISPYLTKHSKSNSTDEALINKGNLINHHRYKSSTTSFFNSLDDSLDLQSCTDSVKDLELPDPSKSNPQPSVLAALDNVSIATNKRSSYSSALTSPFSKLKINSTTEPEEYSISQPPEINIDNVNITNESKFNPQRVSLISSMSYTTYKSCQTDQTEISEYQDCIDETKKNNY